MKEGFTFLSGCAPMNGYILFAREQDELAANGTPNSTFLHYYRKDAAQPFRQFTEAVGWPAISMATIKPGTSGRVVVAIGPNGDYWECEPASVKETVGAIVKFKGNLRALSVVDDVIYACGMGRVVLQRQSTGVWQPLGPPARQNDPDITGFEDIAGSSKDEMYAVGWGGEIWWCDKGKWGQVDSPTSVMLKALAFGDDDNVYIVGQSGTMLRGRRDAWTLIDTGRQENLMDVACYGGQVYVTTDFRILKLEDDKLVNDTDFADPKDKQTSSLYLLRSQDGVVSLGQKEIFLRDGDPWKRLV